MLQLQRPELPYTLFENLDDFKDLHRLVNHILKSLEVKEIKILLPLDLDRSLIDDPRKKVPVDSILIGATSFGYIRYKADDIIRAVNERARTIGIDSSLGYEGRLELLTQVVTDISMPLQYFDSTSPIRYMSGHAWKIAVRNTSGMIEEELDYPSSKIDLISQHWKIIQDAFLIRRHLLDEISSIINIEIEKLTKELTDTKYSWGPGERNNEYGPYELLFAIVYSGYLKYGKGDETTFARDFLKLLGISDKNLAYYRDKILSRANRPKLLNFLADCLENWGKPIKRK